MVGKIAGAIFGFFAMVGSAFVTTFKRSRVFAVVSVVVIAVCVFGLVDAGMAFGKVYQGVHVGTIDLSGKTLSEAENAIRATYEDRVDTHQVFIFANEETANSLGTDVDSIVEGEELSEQLSYEEAQQSKRLWVVNGANLKAEVPYQELARQAMAIGREDGGPLKRIGLLFGGETIDIYANYGEDEFEDLAHDIDTAIGEPRIDYDIAIEDGQASVTEGHTGAMIDRGELKTQLDEMLLHSDEETGSFVARVEYAPLRIEPEQAQETADAVNSLLASEISFDRGGEIVSVSRDKLGDWIETDVVEANGGWRLLPLIDEETAIPGLTALLNQSDTHATAADGSQVAVKFEKTRDGVQVITQGEIMLPLLDEALTQMDDQLFAAYRDHGDATPVQVEPITIETYRFSGTLPFDEACDYGVIGRISSYTTKYTATSATRNRNHNIHLAADLLNDSICTADGGTWSFNETTGDCNEEAGFLDAGAIREGEYIDEVGGGICQVATTVFNAVYEGGYPIIKRAAHSLYMASYEAGRDAAVNYPELDLIWENDTSSDVLVRTSYTDTTITVALYGVNPGYVVKTTTGEWEEGNPYRVIVKVDEERAPGTSKVETVGTDGKSISVVRSVYDRDGNFLRDAKFNSYYNPIDKVIIAGPDTEIEPEEGHEQVTKKYVKDDR